MIARVKSKRVFSTKSELDVDLKAASHFLKWLDPNAKRFSFQTWDDRNKKNGELTWQPHGSFDRLSEELVRLNRRGAAIAISLNETDLKGASSENIIRVRALFLDLDGAPLKPVYECELPPHLIVQTSPGKFHCYWPVEDGDGSALDEFKAVQRAVAERFDGDPAVALLTARIRLPGFLHNKNDPIVVHEVDAAKRPLPRHWDAILEEFPPTDKSHKPSGSWSGDNIVLPDGVPIAACDEFVDNYYADGELDLLHHYRGAFYGWTGTHYRGVEEAKIEQELYKFLSEAYVRKPNGEVVPFNPKRYKVQEIVYALSRGWRIDTEREAPMWLNRDDEDCPSPSNIVVCENGILDLVTRELIPHDPRLLAMTCLPLAYNPKAEKPKRWYRFLRELWPDDKEARLALAEIFGYLLTSDTRQHKAFIIVGPGRSGKGTIVWVLQQLIGDENFTFQTLKGMGGEFGKWPLIDKKLAVIADARLGPRADVHAVAENLLSISGGDPQTINRKNQSFWTGYLGVRFLVTTNEIPAIADASGVLASRFVLLRIKESFQGREDIDLKDKLIPELAGILNWSLRGLDRFRERGRFIMPKSSRDDIRQMEALASPVKTFLQEWCETGSDKCIDTKSLYHAYIGWAKDSGLRPQPVNVFGRELKALLPHLETPGSGAKRKYLGVTLSDRGHDQYERLQDGGTK